MQTHFENFSLLEFLESDTAKAQRIDNFPTFADVAHLSELCETFLQPLRNAWGSGINVTSGFRSKKLNNAVGGSDTSAHRIGYAADLQPANGRFDDFVKFTLAWVAKNNIKFDQILVEHDRKSGARWLHVGLRNNSGHQRMQVKNIDL